MQAVLNAVGRGEIDLVLSTASLVEVLPAHGSDDPDMGSRRELVLESLESSRAESVDVSPPIARLAATYRGSIGPKKSMDAIHLATAVLAKVDALVTSDVKDFPTGTLVGGVRVIRGSAAAETLLGDRPYERDLIDEAAAVIAAPRSQPVPANR